MQRSNTFFPQRRGGGKGNRPETFHIVVERYDTTAKPPVVHGIRQDTMEAVSVSLRTLTDVKRKGSHKRSEIADFAAPRVDKFHPGTTPGGILLIQEAYRNNGSEFAARWIQSLSHTPGEAQVMIAMVHVGEVRRKKADAEYPDGKPFASLTVVHDGDFRGIDDNMYGHLGLTEPFAVENTEKLQEALTELLAADIGCGVRVSNGDTMDAVFVSHNRDDDANESAAKFIETIKSLTESIDDGSLKCEVIPYSRIWAGPKTVDLMLSNNVFSSRVAQFNYKRKDEKDEEKVITERYYRPAIVAVRLAKPDAQGNTAPFFAHFEPLRTLARPNPKADPENPEYDEAAPKFLVVSAPRFESLTEALCYAQTETVRPEYPKRESAEPEADADETPGNVESFDSEKAAIDGTDLVGAVTGAANESLDIGEPMTGTDVPQQQRAPRSYTRRGARP